MVAFNGIYLHSRCVINTYGFIQRYLYTFQEVLDINKAWRDSYMFTINIVAVC